MNILFITVRSDTGGGPKHLFDLIRTIKKSHPDFYCTIASPKAPPFGERFEEEADHFIKIPHRSFCPISFFRLLAHCRENDIQIVHSHGRGAGYYSRLLGLFGVKVVHTFHGAHAEKTIIGRAKVFIDSVLKNLTDKLISVSEDECKTSLEIGINKASSTIVIPNGIDHKSIKDEFDKLNRDTCRDLFSLPKEARIWGTLSRLSYQKGIDLFLEFELPEDVLFAIAGDGEEKESLLSKLTEDKKKRIVFLGNIEKPITFLKCLDGYFSSSRWEGLPLSVLEAMSCELPCLLSKVDGHRELSGVGLFNLKDKKDFLESFDRLQLDSLGSEGAGVIKKKYTLELMAEKTYSTYCHL